MHAFRSDRTSGDGDGCGAGRDGRAEGGESGGGVSGDGKAGDVWGEDGADHTLIGYGVKARVCMHVLAGQCT